MDARIVSSPPGRSLAAIMMIVMCACASSRGGGPTSRANPAPAPATAPSPSTALAGAPEKQAVGAPATQSLWAIGQPACPSTGTSTSANTGGGSAAPGTLGGANRGVVGADTVGRGPAIILRASASAREVRFASQPQIVVRLCGGTFDSVRVIERRNLPSPVAAGTTYRDVYIAVEILGHLDAACIASKLGASTTPTPGPCGSLAFSDSAGVQRSRTSNPTRP
ncbi:MAG: hypothetical protein HOQ09_10760 [Gemmatimonadaceae bacterium]|nr:hypothetical protein [Gemmatimonadaceae bacterium]